MYQCNTDTHTYYPAWTQARPIQKDPVCQLPHHGQQVVRTTVCRSYIPRHLRLLVNSILNILNILNTIIILTTPRRRRNINKPPPIPSHDPKVLVIPEPRLLSRIPTRRRRRRRRPRRNKAPSTTGDIMSPTDIRLYKTTDNTILSLSHHHRHHHNTTSSTTLDTILLLPLREKLW